MRNHLRSLLSPSMFVALLALVIALSSASVAAVMINGKQIKKNTVSSAQIKNKTIKTKDMSPKTISKLTGQTGAAGVPGAKGADGATGPQGPVGPSNAYSVSNDNYTVMAGSKTVLALDLPAGSYVVQSTAWGQRTSAGGGSYVICSLRVDGVAKDRAGEHLPDELVASGSLANQVAFTSGAAAQVTLLCVGDNAGLTYKKITATKVGSVVSVVGADVG